MQACSICQWNNKRVPSCSEISVHSPCLLLSCPLQLENVIFGGELMSPVQYLAKLGSEERHCSLLAFTPAFLAGGSRVRNHKRSRNTPRVATAFDSFAGFTSRVIKSFRRCKRTNWFMVGLLVLLT